VDAVAVRGGARVLAVGDLLVMSGGLDADDALSVPAGSSLEATHQLELVGVPLDNISGEVGGSPLVCDGCP